MCARKEPEPSLRLNRWEQSQSSTTGNSSPFDLWMVIICTASLPPACSPAGESPRPLSRSRSIKVRKP